MDGFTGSKRAAAEELPDARVVMDPLHVVYLARDTLDEHRRRIQQELRHRRRRATDPSTKPAAYYTPDSAYSRLVSSTRIDLFAIEEHVALDVTWNAYQNIIDAYRAPNTRMGKAMTEAEINTLTSRRVPRGLTELITLGKTLKRRARDILAYYNHPHTTGDPTEVINGRPEHLRGSTPELAKLTHYITRALLETGEFRPEQHPQL